MKVDNYGYSSFVCQHTYFSLVGLFSKHHNSFSLHDILNIHWTVEQRLHANYGGSATTFNKNEVSLPHDREYPEYFQDSTLKLDFASLSKDFMPIMENQLLH